MQLGRYSVSTLRPPPIYAITFSPDGRFFAVAGETGYEVWKVWPLGLVRRRVLPGTLALALILPHAPLLVLQGGGSTPLYAPNKVVFYHDRLGVAVAELEFGERIRGIQARRGTVCVALLRKVIAFEYGVGDDLPQDLKSKAKAADNSKGKGKGKAVEPTPDGFWVRKIGEWETAENELGLMALSTAPGSTLLALPGRQVGHVQLVQLAPCPTPPTSPFPGSQAEPAPPAPTAHTFRSPIILAHTHALSTLTTTPSGSHILTTSERGTLLRVWDTTRGRLERELRRGVDRAEMWGAEFEGAAGREGKEGRVVGWSDKGTIHVWGDEERRGAGDGSRPSTPTQTPSLAHLLSRNLPLPKYFSSTASTAQYHLPRKNPHAFSAALGAAGVNMPSISMRDGGEDEGERGERFVVTWVEVDVVVDDDHERDRDRDRERERERERDDAARAQRRLSGAINTMGGSLPMGSREERRSFGSDGTSRTATPLGRETPTPSAYPAYPHAYAVGAGGQPGARGRKTSHVGPGRVPSSSAGSGGTATATGTASGAGSPHVRLKTHGHAHTRNSSQPGARAPRVEKQRQLVAITYSGDWYRLKIPDGSGSGVASGSGGDGEQGAGSGGKDGEGEREGKGKCELVEYRRLGVGGEGW
ncbi:hypothetical protein IAT38_006672 [Cryptococcus sp. DSM 104549]